MGGSFTLVGATSSYGAGNFDAWLIKTDADGNLQYNQTYGGVNHDTAYSGILTVDGGFVLAGFTKFQNRIRRLDMDLWVLKLDAAGNELWNQTYGGEWFDEATSVIQTSNNGFLLAGRTRSYDAYGWDAWLVKTDALGVAPDIEVLQFNWFEIGLLGSLVVAAIVILVLGVRIWKRGDKWRKKPGVL